MWFLKFICLYLLQLGNTHKGEIATFQSRRTGDAKASPIRPSRFGVNLKQDITMGTAQVEVMSPVCTFVRPKRFVKSQSFNHRKTLSQPETQLAEIVESLSKFTFAVSSVDSVKEEPDDEKEYMAKCECCGLAEECTPGYVARMKAMYCGRLLCGLCGEAVKEERMRMGPVTSMEDALSAHMKICFKFNTFTRQDPAADLAQAMRQILRKSIELGTPPKTKGLLWQRAGLSRSETFSNRGHRKSLP